MSQDDVQEIISRAETIAPLLAGCSTDAAVKTLIFLIARGYVTAGGINNLLAKMGPNADRFTHSCAVALRQGIDLELKAAMAHKEAQRKASNGGEPA